MGLANFVNMVSLRRQLSLKPEFWLECFDLSWRIFIQSYFPNHTILCGLWQRIPVAIEYGPKCGTFQLSLGHGLIIKGIREESHCFGTNGQIVAAKHFHLTAFSHASHRSVLVMLKANIWNIQLECFVNDLAQSQQRLLATIHQSHEVQV